MIAPLRSKIEGLEGLFSMPSRPRDDDQYRQAA